MFLISNTPTVSCCTIHIVTDKSEKIVSNIIKHGFSHFNKEPLHDNNAVGCHATLVFYMTAFEKFEGVKVSDITLF
jgi:hypothetical protein